MAPGIRRRVRTAVIGFACAGAAAVAIVVLTPATLPSSRFEFGIVTEMTGVLRRLPYPVLETGGRRVWLVGAGKRGAEAVLEEVPNGWVLVRGSRIQRGRHEMLEVHGAAIREPRSAIRDHGSTVGDSRVAVPTDPPIVTLRGEIVDSKCFLGVMNPAEGAVHRDCARRCLSGGIPPMLLVRDGAHREELVVLVSADGDPIGREIRDAAGVSVEATGRLVQDGDTNVLYVAGVVGGREAVLRDTGAPRSDAVAVAGLVHGMNDRGRLERVDGMR